MKTYTEAMPQPSVQVALMPKASYTPGSAFAHRTAHVPVKVDGQAWTLTIRACEIGYTFEPGFPDDVAHVLALDLVDPNGVSRYEATEYPHRKQATCVTGVVERILQGGVTWMDTERQMWNGPYENLSNRQMHLHWRMHKERNFGRRQRKMNRFAKWKADSRDRAWKRQVALCDHYPDTGMPKVRIPPEL